MNGRKTTKEIDLNLSFCGTTFGESRHRMIDDRLILQRVLTILQLGDTLSLTIRLCLSAELVDWTRELFAWNVHDV